MQIANINTNEQRNIDFDPTAEKLIAYGYDSSWKPVNDELATKGIKWQANQWVEDVEKQNKLIIKNIEREIESIDKKRIRAIAEPSLKDAGTGETWLEYYTSQISELRSQISGLS